MEKLLNESLALHPGVDGIINNAGIIQPFVRLNDLSYESIERVINVNLYGTLYMIKTFLPHLLTRPEAHIVNISSMGGFLPVPGQTIYGASKAAVKLLSEGLHSELMNTHVMVTVAISGSGEYKYYKKLRSGGCAKTRTGSGIHENIVTHGRSTDYHRRYGAGFVSRVCG